MVSKQVASAVAAIAAIEIPRGQWMELVPNLCITSTNEDPLIRKASLEAIGFICEELETSHFTQEIKN